MKKFLAGVAAGFLIATCVGLFLFRYQISTVTAGGFPFAYRLDRVTGHTDVCVISRQGLQWRSVPDKHPIDLDFVPESASTSPSP